MSERLLVVILTKGKNNELIYSCASGIYMRFHRIHGESRCNRNRRVDHSGHLHNQRWDDMPKMKTKEITIGVLGIISASACAMTPSLFTQPLVLSCLTFVVSLMCLIWLMAVDLLESGKD
jgi:hypothetical protein